MTARKPRNVEREIKRKEAIRDGQEAARILDDPHFKAFMQRYEDYLYQLMLRIDTSDTEKLKDMHYRIKAAKGLSERLRRYVVTMDFEQSMFGED